MALLRLAVFAGCSRPFAATAALLAFGVACSGRSVDLVTPAGVNVGECRYGTPGADYRGCAQRACVTDDCTTPEFASTGGTGGGSGGAGPANGGATSSTGGVTSATGGTSTTGVGGASADTAGDTRGSDAGAAVPRGECVAR